MSRRTRVLLISVGVIASVGMLIARPWGRGQPLDFSDPDKFLVRTTDGSGKELVLKRVNDFASDFETGIARKIEGWHQTLTLSSGTKSGNAANRVETTTEQVHSGEFSLKTYTPKDPNDLQKATLLRELFFFPPGSDCWYSARYFIPGQASIENLFIFDLEATQNHGLGRRLMFTGRNGQYLMLEGKRSTGPQYAQKENPVAFPRNQWVHVKLHLHLSASGDGKFELWQDGKLVLDKQGANMPSNTFYDRIEVGQTANTTHQEQTVYVDDVRVSDKPIE